MTTAELITFATDLGFSIVIPIALLTFGGRFIDKKFDTAPWFMIGGLLISVFVTGYIVFKKTKKLM